MAHLSGDEALIEAFRHGEDIHRATAARLFGIPLAEVTPEHRRKAKTANFGIIYGISAFGLKQRMGNITMEEAKRIIDGYFTAYPKVKEYMERVVAQAPGDGIRRNHLRPPPIPARHPFGQLGGTLPGRAKRHQRPHTGQRRRHHQNRHDRSTVNRRPRHPFQSHPPGTRRTGHRHAPRGTGGGHGPCPGGMEHAARLRVELVVECGVGENWLEAH